MSPNGRRAERPGASIEELIIVVQRESAAALSVAEAFLPDAHRLRRVDFPHRFPAPDRLPGGPVSGPRDGPAAPLEITPAERHGR